MRAGTGDMSGDGSFQYLDNFQILQKIRTGNNVSLLMLAAKSGVTVQSGQSNIFLQYICLLSEYNSVIVWSNRAQKGDISMALTTLTARVDQKDKADFDAFCSNVGLNTSTAINLFVKAVLREKRIPFEIAQSPDPFFSEANMAYVRKSVQELREGKGTAHELIEVENE